MHWLAASSPVFQKVIHCCKKDIPQMIKIAWNHSKTYIIAITFLETPALMVSKINFLLGLVVSLNNLHFKRFN